LHIIKYLTIMRESKNIEIVLSPVEDEKINANLQKSEIWKNAYKPEEVTDEVKAKYPRWFKYHIKFNGLKPVQVTKIEKI